jgi:molecular chaperone GrpE (heat shock protein)
MILLLPCTLQSGYKMHDRILRAAKVIVYQE